MFLEPLELYNCFHVVPPACFVHAGAHPVGQQQLGVKAVGCSCSQPPVGGSYTVSEHSRHWSSGNSTAAGDAGVWGAVGRGVHVCGGGGLEQSGLLAMQVWKRGQLVQAAAGSNGAAVHGLFRR